MIREIEAKSILNKYRKIDSWFISSYSANLYRGCLHNCVYCDGRDERYGVDGEFGRDVVVKKNAVELLKKELNPAGKRKPFKGGFFTLCGGVSDSYQPFERERGLARRALEVFLEFGHPVHILTKSILVERDMDIIMRINDKSRAVVSMSFSSVDDHISRLLEPGVPPPSERLAVLSRFKDAGVACGMFLMPVVPFITDSAEMIERSVYAAKQAGLDFVIFSGMTLKDGRQKDYFYSFLRRSFPELCAAYDSLYGGGNSWGTAVPEYYAGIEGFFSDIARAYSMPVRVFPEIFSSIVSVSELVIVMLEQLDYVIRLRGGKSHYAYAARSISACDRPVESLSYQDLTGLSGIGSSTARMIREIVDTGCCKLYRQLVMNESS